jgi:drug/metabolite transporter superfamily protein YnfA
MQSYTIFFIIVDALHVSGGFSAHHQELKNCKHNIWYVPGLLLLQLAVAAAGM